MTDLNYTVRIRFSVAVELANGSALQRHIDDLAHSLNKTFRRDYQGGCSLILEPGVATLKTNGAPREELEACVHAFRDGMHRNGLRLIYSVE